jgi:hypothetical protein
LQKEAQDLDLLLKSYEKILELQGNKADIYPNKTSNDSPSKRNRVIEAKKPTFLMSYEEREEERKMLKQLTREQRIEDEKKRFLQLFQQKNAREQAKDLYLSKMQLKRHQASRKIQRWIRKTWRDWSLNERVRQSSAATRIQAKWKFLLIYRKYPARLREFKRQKELKLMSIEERMMRQFMAIERKIAKKTVRRDSYDINLNMVNELLVSLNQDQENDKEGKEEESVKPHVLVEYWRKLRRIFILANEKGSTFQFLFEQLDLKRDKIIDRSEFRLGLKQFGVPITRQLTRA